MTARRLPCRFWRLTWPGDCVCRKSCARRLQRFSKRAGWIWRSRNPSRAISAWETGGERRESTADTLEAGGWIRCATAWAVAARHEIALRRLGALLNALDIKVRKCSLGCFE